MRILIVHPENRGVAGAEKVLEYFLTELVESDFPVAVAVAPGSRMAKLLPPKAMPVWIEPNDSFSLGALWRQAQALKRQRAKFPFDIIHGWAARDWELASVTGWLSHRPAIGSLHDHPNATFISGRRRRLMRCCARLALKKITCVSAAVQNACVEAGYPVHKLNIVHNGLPAVPDATVERIPGPFRIGFLGAFSERKGLELHLAGNAQDEGGERLLAELRDCYETKSWWRHVHWHGWVESPRDFLQTLDLLVVPSSEFDPFPTVLLEAGQAGVPVLAARVGGVPEIVADGQTGWLFEPGDVAAAVEILKQAMAQAASRQQISGRAVERIKKEFSAAKMVAEFSRIYSTL
ncbi:MAG: glycosyltransferase family 4 protein [Verrucomicrobiota bacterium]